VAEKSLANRLEKLEAEADALVAEYHRRQGELDSLFSRLETEFNCKNLQELKDEIQHLSSAIEKLGCEIESLLDELEELISNVQD